MASFNGRPAPNVSQYLRELNTISPLDTTGTEAFIEDDLSIFTNTQFYDYETGQKTDYQAQPSKVATAAPTPAASTAGDAVLDDVSHLDFMSGELFLLLLSTRLIFPTCYPASFSFLRLVLAWIHVPGGGRS